MSERGAVMVEIPLNWLPRNVKEQNEILSAALEEARFLVKPPGKVLGVMDIDITNTMSKLVMKIKFAVDAPESAFYQRSVFAT